MLEGWLLIGVTTFLAATLQNVTGFGFGLLCVPVFLWVLDSIAAIHLVTIITLIMSIAILPTVRKQVAPELLRILSLGVLIGSPLGIAFAGQLDLDVLKAVAAITILLITLWNAYHYLHYYFTHANSANRLRADNRGAELGVGVISGVLGSTLAMPAPLVMMYLSGTHHSKEAIRSTILVFFIIAYGAALVCQVIVQGVEPQTWKSALLLTPVALAGAWLGNRLSSVVSALLFRIIVFITLIVTSISMLLSVMGN